uniref:Peptidase S1 domain-containing protein n=1 Tax=Panagrolaimus sp. ES5 TaxID=591445 RepID=A0AC34GGH0_9BILA
MLPLLSLILMTVCIGVIGKPTVSKKYDNYFPCGESPSIPKYINYNNIVVNSNNKKLLKIIHGHDSIENDWPWIVTLYDGDVNACTGSIISPNYILSANHCFFSDNVGYGSVDLKRQRIVKVIERHFINNTDFGLLKVEKPFEFDGKHVAPICLSSKFDANPSEILVAAGFGEIFVKTVISKQGTI